MFVHVPRASLELRERAPRRAPGRAPGRADSRRAARRLGAAAVAAGLGLTLLVRLHPAAWAGRPDTDPLSALVWVAWVLAVALAGWLLVGIGLSVAAGLSRRPSLLGLARRVAAPAVRRLAEQATAMSFVVSAVVAPSPALAQPEPPIPVIAVVEQSAVAEAPEPDPPAEAPRIDPGPLGGLPRLLPAPAALPPEVPAPAGYTVQPGDNLWSISCAKLTSHLGRPPSDAETAGYWRIVVDTNLTALRSGDADLIHPGETITLPAPP